MPAFVSYAQNFEDVMLWRALKHVESGFYIDVGANDPTLDSVTKAFYARCWHGINIEPTAFYFERLAHERPADINLRVAAGAERGLLALHEVAQTGLSTTQPDVAAQHRREGYDVVTQEVETLPLDEICAAHVTGDIHFLKIDVEGGEQDVLSGLDLARWRPWILVIEATRPMSQDETYQEWEPLLLSHRYGFAYADGLNRFYVAEEHPELIPAFRYPPNVFDGFISNTHEASVMRMQESDVRAAQSRQALVGAMAATQAAEDRADALDRELAAERERVRGIEEEAARHADERAAWIRRRDDERAAWEKRHSEASKAAARHLAAVRADLEERARARQHTLDAKLQQATALIAEMHASTSWRVSAPIRGLKLALQGGVRFPGRAVRGLRRRLGEIKRQWLRPSRPIADRFEQSAPTVFQASQAQNAAPISPGAVADAIRRESRDWKRASTLVVRP